MVLCGAFTQAVNAQYLHEYMHLPGKYKTPEVGVSATGTNSEFTEDIWRVYADRDHVMIYSDPGLTQVTDSARFLEAFVAWEETGNAVKVVSQGSTGRMFSGEVFGEGAVDRGWIDKRQLILWPQSLRRNGLRMKALISHTLESSIPDKSKPTRQVRILEGEFRIYNVMKSEAGTMLLLNADEMNAELGREDAFWVNRDEITLIESRKAFIPVWDEVLNGEVIHVYGSNAGARSSAMDDVLFTIEEVDPFVGFLNPRGEKASVLTTETVIDGTMRRTFLDNTSGTSYEKAYLVDYTQFLMYKELIEIITSNEFLTPEDLEIGLADFFFRYGFTSEGRDSLTVGGMMEKITGIRFDRDGSELPLRVALMGPRERTSLLKKYTTYAQMMMDEALLDQYRFDSDEYYYWLPESWINPTQLFRMALGNIDPKKPPPRSYRSYELFYVDGSSVNSVEASILNKMHDDLRQKIQLASSLSGPDSQHGVYAYLSHGEETVQNDHRRPFESTVDELLGKLRGGTYFPDKHRDKREIESEVLTHQVVSVFDTLMVHFYIPQGFFEEDLWDHRGHMLLELPERIYSLSMPKFDGITIININLYDIHDEVRLDRDIATVLDTYGLREKYLEVKFNKFN